MEKALVLQLSERKFHDLYLCSCGYAECEPLHNFGPAVRPYYILHYILEGKGRYYAEDRKYELQAGQGFLIEPEKQTFYQADKEEPWTYLWVGFGGSHAQAYLKDLGLNSSQLIFQCSHAAELKRTVLHMLKNGSVNTVNQFFLESLLYSFFAVLAQDIDVMAAPESNRDNLYIRKAIGYVQNHYSSSIRVTDIANYVCIDRSYLYTLFRKNMNMSPQDYLANYRITRATELLLVSDLPVADIALSCGYRDPLVFAKAFKQKRGISPSQFRKKKQKDVKAELQKHQDILARL